MLVLSHEFGHFIVAKFFNIKVDEFGFGFPPKIFGIKKGETTYTLNLLPFGGFVKIFGEDPTQEHLASVSQEDKNRSFISKSRAVQAAVIVAGVVFNLLLAWFLFAVGFVSGMPMPVGATQNDLDKYVKDQTVYITGVLKDSPAEKARLMSGDKIVYVSDSIDETRDVQIETVKNFIAAHTNTEITIGYERKGVLESAKLTPLSGIVANKGAIGISMETVGIVKMPIWRAAYHSFTTTLDLFYLTVVGFLGFVRDIFVGESSFEAVSGPIGIIEIVKQAYGFGLVYLIGLTALISVNLAVLNLIPFPALDGGRLLFLLIESIRRKSLNQKFVVGANMVGFFALIFLMLLVTYHDLLKIFS